nr:hypothetical protein [Alicyclobacillus sp. SO9]
MSREGFILGTSRYHCCASCVYFRSERRDRGELLMYCSRLGYDTKPSYQFNCWTPKERVRERILKDEALQDTRNLLKWKKF